MMLKYKVGDRVISNNKVDTTEYGAGAQGVVTEIVESHPLVDAILGGYHPYRVMLDKANALGLYREEELEAVA